MLLSNSLHAYKGIRIYLACTLSLLIASHPALPQTAGTLDTNFDTDGLVKTGIMYEFERFNHLAEQSDGKIVAVGYHNYTNDDFAILRFNVNGTLDNTFDTDGKVIFANSPFGPSRDQFWGVDLQSDGKIVVVGLTIDNATSQQSLVLARFNTNGSLDNTFDTDGLVNLRPGGNNAQGYNVKVLSDGKIMVAGLLYGTDGYLSPTIFRFTSTGALDTSFDSDGYVSTDVTEYFHVDKMIIQSDGKILVSGDNRIVTSSLNYATIIRYNSDGSLDTGFSGDGIVSTLLPNSTSIVPQMNIALQADGKIVLAASSTNAGNLASTIYRYNANGTLDTGFDTDGKVFVQVGASNDFVLDVVAQPNGKIVVSGRALNGVSGLSSDAYMICLNSNGSLNTNFDGDGIVTFLTGTSQADDLTAIISTSDGKIVGAGQFNGDFMLARLHGDNTAVNSTPTDISLSLSNIAENVSANAVVGTFSTTDDGSTFTYELVSGVNDTDNELFIIDGNDLKINNSPDFETASSYSIRIKTTDAGGLTYEKVFTLSVTDVNDAPQISAQTFSIAENSSLSSVIGAVTASDQDASQTLSFSIISGNTNNVFSINSSTGEITIAGDLDFETAPSYTLTIQATDNNGTPLSSTATITINITDLVETATKDRTLTSLIQVYPNPSSGELHVEAENFSADQYMLRIVTLQGQTIYSNFYSGPVELSELPKGIYLLTLEKGDHQVSRKFVVQ